MSDKLKAIVDHARLFPSAWHSVTAIALADLMAAHEALASRVADLEEMVTAKVIDPPQPAAQSRRKAS